MSEWKVSETEAAIKALRSVGYDPVLKLRGNKRKLRRDNAFIGVVDKVRISPGTTSVQHNDEGSKVDNR